MENWKKEKGLPASEFKGLSSSASTLPRKAIDSMEKKNEGVRDSREDGDKYSDLSLSLSPSVTASYLTLDVCVCVCVGLRINSTQMQCVVPSRSPPTVGGGGTDNSVLVNFLFLTLFCYWLITPCDLLSD